jgi:hypothetical protein
MLMASAVSATTFTVTLSPVRSKRITQNGVTGTLQYSHAIVGSDEPAQLGHNHDFSIMLSANGPAGTCTAQKNGNFADISPPSALVRFQIFYPDSKRPKGPRPGWEIVPPVDYNLRAQTFGEFKIIKQEVRKFSPGGTVACIALP